MKEEYLKAYEEAWLHKVFDELFDDTLDSI